MLLQLNIITMVYSPLGGKITGRDEIQSDCRQWKRLQAFHDFLNGNTKIGMVKIR